MYFRNSYGIVFYYDCRMVIRSQISSYIQYCLFRKVHHTIENRLKTLQEQFFDKIPHEMATFGFRATGLISKIQSKVKKIPNTWSVSVFPPNCTVEFGSCLTVHKSQTFLVKLRDCQKEEALKNNDLDEVLEKIDVKVITRYSKGNYIFFCIILHLVGCLLNDIGSDLHLEELIVFSFQIKNFTNLIKNM